MSLPLYHTFYNAEKERVSSNRADMYAWKDLEGDELNQEGLAAIFKFAVEVSKGEISADKAKEIEFVGIARAGYKPRLVPLHDLVKYASRPGVQIGYCRTTQLDESKRAVIASAFPAFKK